MARDQAAYFVSRRSFCWTLAGVFIASRIAVAQTSKVRRIGVLENSAPDTPEDFRRQAKPLRQLGWVEGKNLIVERRYTNGHADALQALAEELVRANVEIIVTGGTPATLAAKRTTTTIPIVFRAAADPVLVGVVTNLARPGGNVTGFALSGPEAATKQMSILKDLLPGIRRVGVLDVPSNPYFGATRRQFEQVCRSLELDPVY